MSARTRSLLLTIVLLGAGCTTPPDWYTPLMKAAYKGQAEEVLRLIRDKANVNEPAPDVTYLGPFPYQYAGTTPLMAAARGGQLGTAKVLLEHGANVNAVALYNATEATALMIAAQNGHADMMKLLLAHRADVHTRSAWGQTALMRASENGHLEAVRLLVEHGADINAKFHGAHAAPPLPYPVTALNLAGGHKDVADFLTQRGATASAPAPALKDKGREGAMQGGIPAVLDLILEISGLAILVVCFLTYVYPWNFESRFSRVLVHLPLSLLVLFPLYESLPMPGANIRIDLVLFPLLILVALICYYVKLTQMPQKSHHAAANVAPQERPPAVAPDLWNPYAAGFWSLILTPIFGSILVLKNWQAIGDDTQIRTGLIWLVASIVVQITTISATILIPKFGYFISVGYIIMWYFLWLGKQAQYVKERWGNDYPRKGWAVPLLIGISAVVAYGLLVQHLGW